jgi:hypothetical protein
MEIDSSLNKNDDDGGIKCNRCYYTVSFILNGITHLGAACEYGYEGNPGNSVLQCVDLGYRCLNNISDEEWGRKGYKYTKCFVGKVNKTVKSHKLEGLYIYIQYSPGGELRMKTVKDYNGLNYPRDELTVHPTIRVVYDTVEYSMNISNTTYKPIILSDDTNIYFLWDDDKCGNIYTDAVLEWVLNNLDHDTRLMEYKIKMGKQLCYMGKLSHDVTLFSIHLQPVVQSYGVVRYELSVLNLLGCSEYGASIKEWNITDHDHYVFNSLGTVQPGLLLL